MIKMGIIGAGVIARTMAATMRAMVNVECRAIASRDMERARAYADEFGFAKAYGSYEEMLQDPELQLVYIATPHSHHYEQMKLCLNYGKHILCEKSFTINAQQAREVLELGRRRGLLVAEAIWTRYLPMQKTLNDLLAAGTIGRPQMLTANLGYLISGVERIMTPELAGGALLDVGVYPLNFAAMVFGTEIDSLTGTAVMSDRGVDLQNSMTLTYRDGRMAVLNSSAVGLSDRRGVIYGGDGYIEVDNINNCEGIRVYNKERTLIASYEQPQQITGFEYEVEACVRAIESGGTECPQMPHQEIIRIMEWMDELRRQWGLRYPGEGVGAQE